MSWPQASQLVTLSVIFLCRYIVNKTAGKLALKFLVTPTKAADDTKVIVASVQEGFLLTKTVS